MGRFNSYTPIKVLKKNRQKGMSSPNPGKRKIYFTIGGDKDGAPKVPEIIVKSSWNPGKTFPSKQFKSNKNV